MSVKRVLILVFLTLLCSGCFDGGGMETTRDFEKFKKERTE